MNNKTQGEVTVSGKKEFASNKEGNSYLECNRYLLRASSFVLAAS